MFMPKGSLNKHIFSSKANILNHEKTYDIAIGVACGINLAPKILDIGLAKLYLREDSIVHLTCARGIFRYTAPEMLCKNIGGVSCKLTKRKGLNAFTEHLSQIYFPTWIYDQFHDGKDIKIQDAIEDERKICNKMMIIVLWCIKVIKMLEGELECLQVPLKPLLLSPKREIKGVKDNPNQASSPIQSDESSHLT
ncbi:hypothetical protein I3760_05G230500 [Carya illinoinensis]|nr:hypothetical protein I3760_05G230500 [Carya illinoinensis]